MYVYFLKFINFAIAIIHFNPYRVYSDKANCTELFQPEPLTFFPRLIKLNVLPSSASRKTWADEDLLGVQIRKTPHPESEQKDAVVASHGHMRTSLSDS